MNHRSRALPVVALFLALAVASSGRAELYRIPLDCPWCSKTYDALQSPDPVIGGGVDSDFCTYSTQRSTRSFEVQTCPHCGYSAPAADLLAGKPIPEDARPAISAVLAEHWSGPFSDAERVPIALKFRLTYLIAVSSGASVLDSAKLAHLGAWAVRDKVTFRVVTEAFRNPIPTFEEFDRRYSALALKAQEDLPAAFELLQLSVRLGLPASRDRIIAQIREAATRLLPEAAAKSLDSELDAFASDCADESRFLADAVAGFEKALAKEGEVPLEERNTLTYLTGEVYRRLGMQDKAVQWLTEARKDAARSDIRALIPVLLEWIEKGDKPIENAPQFPSAICPLCGSETLILPLSEPDNFGGSDTDLCTHSLSSSAHGSMVSVCLHCRYARYRDDFTKPLSDDQRDRLNDALAARRKAPAPSNPSLLKGWEPFELTAISMTALGDESGRIGMAWLQAGWAARRGLCAPTLEVVAEPGMFMPDMAEKLIKETDDGTFHNLYLCALVAHRAGLVSARDKYFSRAQKMVLGDDTREALLKSGVRIAEQEDGLLKEAFQWLSKATEGTRDAEFNRYICADLMRRLGREREARKALKDCLDLPRVGPMARKLLDSL